MITLVRYSSRLIFLAVAFQLSAIALSAQQIGVSNTAEHVGSGRYSWRIFLIGSNSVLDAISYVEYTLHPTFPNPMRTVTDRASNFSLVGNGWGEFTVKLKVVYRDGRVSYLDHWLRLQPTTTRQPRAAPQAHGPITTGNTALLREERWWEWTVFIEADDATLRAVECVEYTLHPTFPDPVRSVCTRGPTPGRGFLLSTVGWGTFTVGIKVFFNDGEVRYLTHQLFFRE